MALSTQKPRKSTNHEPCISITSPLFITQLSTIQSLHSDGMTCESIKWSYKMDAFYTGVGARNTPEAILWEMRVAARWLWGSGYTLRTGDERGADAAFQKGAATRMTLVYSVCQLGMEDYDTQRWAWNIAQQAHPAWNKCSQYARSLHTRIVFQVLGTNPMVPNPSKFLLCWTADGAETQTPQAMGGTGQAIHIANTYDIPVINMANPGYEKRLDSLV